MFIEHPHTVTMCTIRRHPEGGWTPVLHVTGTAGPSRTPTRSASRTCSPPSGGPATTTAHAARDRRRGRTPPA